MKSPFALSAIVVLLLATFLVTGCNDSTTPAAEKETADTLTPLPVDTAATTSMSTDSLPPIDTTATTRPEPRKTR